MFKNPRIKNVLSACVIAAVAYVAPVSLLLFMFAIGYIFDTTDVEIFSLILVPLSYLVYTSKRSDFAKATYLVIPLAALFNMEVWKIPSKLDETVFEIMSQGISYAVVGLEALILIVFFYKRKMSWMYYFAVLCVCMVLIYQQVFLPPF